MDEHHHLIAPRELSEDESERMRQLLKRHLVIANDDDDEDAENLLDYAVDMIDSGESVGHVTEEVGISYNKHAMQQDDNCPLI